MKVSDAPSMPILVTALGIGIRLQNITIRTSHYNDQPIEISIKDTSSAYLTLDEAKELSAALLQLADLCVVREEARP